MKCSPCIENSFDIKLSPVSQQTAEQQSREEWAKYRFLKGPITDLSNGAEYHLSNYIFGDPTHWGSFYGIPLGPAPDPSFQHCAEIAGTLC